MTVVWLLFISSLVVLPCTALLALRWAFRSGEFKNLPKTALSIFDEDEPVGDQTDFFPGHAPRLSNSASETRLSHSPAPQPPLSS
jgi:hypothetical protein